QLCSLYADIGVHGVYVCGSTGEGFLMSSEERKELTEAVVNAVGHRMSIIVHVGAAASHEAADLAEHAEKCGAHAISAVPSVYYRLPEASIEKHWDTIMEAADLPFFIYNIPQLTGYNLSMGLFNRMIRKNRVRGIKNSSESTYQIQQFRAAAGEDFMIFNGPDEQYLAGRLMGADGGIGGTYGCMPELYLKLERCIKAGDIGSAHRWQTKINEVITKLITFPSLYGACKTIIRKRYIDIGDPRLPFLSVPDNDHEINELNTLIESYVQEID
ncbi:MAG TPA: dihydrodipicolinate synthase family protein, partial [Bacilli bacterium]